MTLLVLSKSDVLYLKASKQLSILDQTKVFWDAVQELIPLVCLGQQAIREVLVVVPEATPTPDWEYSAVGKNKLKLFLGSDLGPGVYLPSTTAWAATFDVFLRLCQMWRHAELFDKLAVPTEYVNSKDNYKWAYWITNQGFDYFDLLLD